MKLVYGDQINLVTFYGTVYEDVEEYKKDYELDDAGMIKVGEGITRDHGCTMHLNDHFDHMPKNLLPATLAVMAGMRQSHEK